jgi:colanic acid/amylovoran biosynthesis glycosyltransferase
VHAHFATTAASVARLSSLFTRIPYTFTAHAKDIFHECVDPSDLMQKIDAAAGVVTVSDFNVHFLNDQFSDCAHKVQRIYNGLDLGQFPFAKPDQRSAKVLAVGRLVEKKGFDSLIDACFLLRQSGTVFCCEIIGAGELEPLLRRHIADLHLERVIRLAGPRPQTAVKEAIRQAAILAVPSVTASTGDRDGLPMVLLEAMALGTTCVATSVTGIPEAVRHEETGLLVPERQPEALAAALKRLLTDVDLRVEMACAARNLIEDEFDIRRNAGLLRDFFSDGRLVDAPPPAFAEVG